MKKTAQQDSLPLNFAHEMPAKKGHRAEVNQIGIEITFEDFYTYLMSRNLKPLVNWLKGVGEEDEYNSGARNHVEKLLNFIVGITPHLDECDTINSYLGLNNSFRIERFDIGYERDTIDFDFRSDDGNVVTLPYITRD